VATRQKSPTKKSVEDHTRHFFLKNLPSYPTISFSWLDEEDESSDGEFLIIRRPVLSPCPRPPADIVAWLLSDWDKETATVSVQPERKSVKDGKVVVETFIDASSRIQSLKLWKEARAFWLADFRPASKAVGVFQTMCEYYGMLQRQSEPLDFHLGDGLLECNGTGRRVNHPVIRAGHPSDSALIPIYLSLRSGERPRPLNFTSNCSPRFLRLISRRQPSATMN